MILLNDSQKVDVLLAALVERYAALRAIRERVQSVGLWALGAMAAIGGYLIQFPNALSSGHRGLSAAALVVALLVLRFMYLRDLQRGFEAQQRVAARLEQVLGFFEAGTYDEAPLYPHQWAEAGRTRGSGRFFAASYALIYVGGAFLLFTIGFVR